MSEPEKVLVFPAEALNEYLVEFKQGIMTDGYYLDDILEDVLVVAHFMDRAAAEVDPSFKQVIPYCVLTNSNGKIFAYRRTKKGGENRLHEMWSIGVGGHINPCDGSLAGQSLYDAALRREIREEVGIELRENITEAAPELALIYDPSNEVGKVHFGVVHLVPVNPADLKIEDPALADGVWKSLDEIRQLAGEGKLENWSNLVVRKLNELVRSI